MDLKNPITLWWLAVGALVAAELLTGKIYVLMLALGAAFGAMAAHAGLGTTAQVVCAVGACVAITLLWHANRTRTPRPSPR